MKRAARTASRKRIGRLRIVVTAGPTREYFDAVRFISNPSSGKMGYALARAAADAGHHVTLITGPVALDPPRGVKTVHVTTAREMAVAAKSAFERGDAAILTAAVCDYRPSRTARRKTRKTPGKRLVELVPTEDIAAALGAAKARRVTVAFAFETHDGRRNAERKMRSKNCDAIVLNGPAAVGADRAKVEVLVRGGTWARFPEMSKRVLARRLLQMIEGLVESRS